VPLRSVVAKCRNQTWNSYSIKQNRRPPPPARKTCNRGSFSGGKAAGTWSWPLTSISCRGQECVALYLHSSSTSSWRCAYLSTGTLPFLPGTCFHPLKTSKWGARWRTYESIAPIAYDWTIGSMIIGQETCSSDVLSTTGPTWNSPVLNPGVRGQKPASYRQSYGRPPCDTYRIM
jgi:hypothetical protein